MTFGEAHHVVALMRTPSKIAQPESERMQKVLDVSAKDVLKQVLPSGADAIVSWIGRPDGKIGGLSDGTRTVVQITTEQNMSRCSRLDMLSWGVGDIWEQMKQSLTGHVVYDTLPAKLAMTFNVIVQSIALTYFRFSFCVELDRAFGVEAGSAPSHLQHWD